MSKPGDKRFAETRLEFIKARAVNDAGNHLANVIRRAQPRRHHAEDFFRIISGLFRALPRHGAGLRAVQMPHRPARQRKRMGIVFGKIIRHPRQARMHIATAKVFCRDDLARCRLHKRRSGKEDSPLFFHDNRHIRHRRHIGATGRARPHHHGNLRDALGAHIGLIKEDPAKVVAIGEHLILLRQVGPARVDKIDTGQLALLSNFLRPQVFLNGHREIGAALHGGIVTDHHDLLALHPANPGNNARTRRGIVIHVMRRRGPYLKERCARIKQVCHPLPRQHLAPAHMTIARPLAAARRRRCCRLGRHTQRLKMRLPVLARLVARRDEFRL